MFLIILFLSNVYANDLFFIHINMYRNNPLAYKNYFHFTDSCDDSQPCNILFKDHHLEKSSLFQASTLSYNNCTEISHKTCPLYLNQFNNNESFDYRIKSFFNETKEINIQGEILLKGSSNITRIFEYFLSSMKHCNMIRNPLSNIIGFNIQHHDKYIFVADFAYYNNYFPRKDIFVSACQRNNDNVTHIFLMNTKSPLNVMISINNESFIMSPLFNKKYYIFKTLLNFKQYYINNKTFVCL